MTSRLHIEPLRPAHAVELLDDLRDPALYTFIDEAPPTSLEALTARFAHLARGGRGDEVWRNWIIRAPDGAPVGTLQATLFPDGRAHVAYLVLRPHQRQGVASAALAWLLAHLRDVEGMTRAEAIIDVRNAASIRLVERLGFTLVETTHGAATIRGEPSDEHRYVLALDGAAQGHRARRYAVSMTDDELIAALRGREDVVRSARPVTAAAIADLAACVGGRLPATLVRVYRDVGSGFGPESGLLAPAAAAAQYAAWTSDEPAEGHEAWCWPPGVLPILDWGCAIYSCVTPDGAVRRFHGDRFVPDDPDDPDPDPERHPTRPEDFAALFDDEAADLAAWFAAWLDGTLRF